MAHAVRLREFWLKSFCADGHTEFATFLTHVPCNRTQPATSHVFNKGHTHAHLVTVRDMMRLIFARVDGAAALL